ncbi:hypothetical protein J2S67_001884 [Pseudoglutamicibacter albus]|uniref:Uncharacterized protein n=1 Tax=Pseudoglutamicibacter albus TaxID=98671 RepID=A0ABU1Z3M8_9MICC|nr:hypothetical protein [Pseudoglutamicibacter albus]MDR7293257.1 hypothetical protein [Pseudoglutamicibacter albus]MDR7294616.1 hypothetical protein [Pseudoglutamicibacter albus]
MHQDPHTPKRVRGFVDIPPMSMAPVNTRDSSTIYSLTPPTTMHISIQVVVLSAP